MVNKGKYTYEDSITYIVGLLGVPSTAKTVFTMMEREGELSKLKTKTKTPDKSVQERLQSGVKNGIYYRFKKEDNIYYYGLKEWEKSVKEEIEKLEISYDTEKDATVKQRKGQQLYKKRVIEVEDHSRLSPNVPVRFLIAGHFKPWSVSTNEERIDGNNGYLGTPNEDKLLNDGYMSFNDDGSILYNKENEELLESLGIDVTANVGFFNNKQREYLKYHRENIFKGL